MSEAPTIQDAKKKMLYIQKNQPLMLRLADFMLQEQLITPAEKIKLSELIKAGDEP